MDPKKIGIYVNAEEGNLVRITSPYWLPPAPQWRLISNDPNITLTTARRLVAELNITDDAASVNWASLPPPEQL